MSTPFCDRAKVLDARTQDRMLRFAAIVRAQLESSDDDVALVSRSGIDLERFDIRYSHSGIALRRGEVPWSVRQLYYACDEGRPRLYDQGIAGFLMNTDETAVGYVSIVTLPRAHAEALEATARDRTLALRLLSARYSANAYPFSDRYQNCNQWVMELLAAALGALSEGDDLRIRAQDWLHAHGYEPARVRIDSHLTKFAGGFMPLVSFDDHPDDERYALHTSTSLPASLERFVQRHVPGASRIELCHDNRHIVVRRGWMPLGEGCRAQPGDRVIALD